MLTNTMWPAHPGTDSGMHCAVAMVPCDNCVNRSEIPFIVRDLLIPPRMLFIMQCNYFHSYRILWGIKRCKNACFGVRELAIGYRVQNG